MPRLLPADTSIARYVETDLAALTQTPRHFKCGIYLICVSGRSIISTGVQQYELRERGEMIFLAGGLLQLVERSDDFRVRMLLFPKATFLSIVPSIDTAFFNPLHEKPCYQHPVSEAGDVTWSQVNLWMDMARMLFSGELRIGREHLERNYLQSVLLWIYNSLPKKGLSDRTFTRKQLLCHQFLGLLHEHAVREHQVGFYADKLCITPRYLNEIVSSYMNGKTPKQLIDEQLAVEIKVLLNDPHLSVAEIALLCNFPDQSYLSRFFRKHTGFSPKEFRTRRL